MNRAQIALIALAALLFTGCATIKIYNIGDEYDQSVKGYRSLIRWHEYDSAVATYVAPSLRDEYQKKIEEAGEVKIVDYRVKREECDPVKGDGTVVMEIDYYRPPSVTMKTLVDNQKWKYEMIGEKGTWRLMTLLPTFK